MIELIRIAVAGDKALDLIFSDGSAGRWSAEAVIARDTVLTRPLEDPAYFMRAFVKPERWPGRTDWNSRPTASTRSWPRRAS